ncbi:hypothetical protein BCR36DRAFT_34009 [Piromyces finnis]|uniref:Uncharacterized protein n=1 Tax=Piromyces finnis TaxID=1754191 RepID=A0A1Y1VBI6_9FUNG|nr:hypothetical protein BCR36DRAFT_34009 [Piromyces finnis]|eukprot:ORX52117.1 hypothetical protein BCR36DRAFT_34009 [Piromyces finnis]
MINKYIIFYCRMCIYIVMIFFILYLHHLLIHSFTTMELFSLHQKTELLYKNGNNYFLFKSSTVLFFF